ncbi:putative amino acid transporter [Salmonella enterica subsp. enterica]|uniref:Putative amino acid transporter n=1 Tax=Salmonella enterica I TaxID=59201 RepID=A0A379WPN4_SALET|nr:putative amino acid transporter [Salmonella enterica subsp. enterica]
MIAGRTRNPQRDFPRAMAVSAAVIVGIYMVGTWALNTLLPAGKTDIVAGVMQAMHAAADTLHMPWLIPVMAICMFLALSGKLTPGWWGRFICSRKPRVKIICWGPNRQITSGVENARLCLDCTGDYCHGPVFFDFYFAKRCGGLLDVNGANDHHLFYSLSGDVPGVLAFT